MLAALSFCSGIKSLLEFVPSFEYLGHIITCNNNDDDDIQREINNMFVRTNIVIRKFCKCMLWKLSCLKHIVYVYMMSPYWNVITSVLSIRCGLAITDALNCFWGFNDVTVSQVFLWILVYLALTLYWLTPHSLLCICGVHVIIT